MCGILGIYKIKDNSIFNHDKFESALLKMKHRGPDAHLVNQVSENLILGHVRLSIIDLSPESNQPLNINENYWIVFNGEIYNYIEIRNELKDLGHEFKTNSDTEVLLKSYIEWGEDCVTKFNGDWAFSIYDIENDILFCSRDRFGVKPFNYAIINKEFVFSSEIKSIIHYFPILKMPNYNVISNYCRNGLGAQIEETWFKDVKRLLPAHNLTIKNGQITIRKYWEYPLQTLKDTTLEQATKHYKELFINAVKIRMRSDVPIGITLSSGLDSSSIVSVMQKYYNQKHKTFTATFDENEFKVNDKLVYKNNIRINEKDIVEEFSKVMHTQPYFVNVKNESFVENLSKLIYHLESGHSSTAIFPLSETLDCAKEEVTVIMEGQGADELLGGYIINTFPFLIYELIKKGQFIQLFHEFREFSKVYSIRYSLLMFFRLLNNRIIEGVFQYYSGVSKIFGPKLKYFKRIKDYPLPNPKLDETFNNVLLKSHKGGLSNLLHYGDAISMSKSLESRNPFLDFKLVEYAFKLPFNFKNKNGLGKYIHRLAMKTIVPDFILNTTLKFGFNTPISKHFDSLGNDTYDILLSDRCLERGLFNEKELKLYINSHIKNNDKLNILYRLLSVELWFRNFID